MKETMHFILGGKNRLWGMPTLFLDLKIKNGFWVQGTFKFNNQFMDFVCVSVIRGLKWTISRLQSTGI